MITAVVGRGTVVAVTEEGMMAEEGEGWAISEDDREAELPEQRVVLDAGQQ